MTPCIHCKRCHFVHISNTKEKCLKGSFYVGMALWKVQKQGTNENLQENYLTLEWCMKRKQQDYSHPISAVCLCLLPLFWSKVVLFFGGFKTSFHIHCRTRFTPEYDIILQKNTFCAGDKHFWPWRWKGFTLATNASVLETKALKMPFKHQPHTHIEVCGGCVKGNRCV